MTCYVDDKRRQTKAAKRVDPLGKNQLPTREARYLGPAMDPLSYSFPGGHRVWEIAEGKVNQYSTLVASNPLDMPTTREHASVYSRQDPPSDDEDDPYALPPEEEVGREDLTVVSDIDYVRHHSQASDTQVVGPHRQTRAAARATAVNFVRHSQQYQGCSCQ